MWKIIFTYPDGVKVKLTNSSIPMDKRLANKYYDCLLYTSVLVHTRCPYNAYNTAAHTGT